MRWRHARVMVSSAPEAFMNRIIRGVLIASTLGIAITLAHQPQASAAIAGAGQVAGLHGSVGADCTFKGKKMFGKVQVVKNFPDIKVQKVDNFPDLKVQFVSNFPDKCGKWQVVDNFPDFKIQYVDNFPDVKIKAVDNFPGL
jgi:hypothetical protein